MKIQSDDGAEKRGADSVQRMVQRDPLLDAIQQRGIRICPPRGNARLLRHAVKQHLRWGGVYRELDYMFGTRHCLPFQASHEAVWIQSQMMAQM